MSEAESTPEVQRKGLHHRLYRWVLHWAGHPHARWALFLIALAESSVFPVPPDVLLIAMCLARPRASRQYAAISTGGSVVGGVIGYAIGWGIWSLVGDYFFRILGPFGFTDANFMKVQAAYQNHAFWAVFTAGFTPIPYKLITISAGVFEIAFGIFVIASTVSRSARFFLEAWICHRYGPPAQAFIEKNFNLVAFAFVVLLVGGFWLVGKV